MSKILIKKLTFQTLFRTVLVVVTATLLCFFSMGLTWAAESSVVSPEKPAEYMIYQYPGVALLIRIDAVEMEFESRVYGAERALIKASRIPLRRIGPVYQFIEAIDTARQLIVEVIPAQTTDRSQISMELIQLPQNERNSSMQSDAFRLFSRAVDSTSANDSTTWAMKIYALQSAANVFEELGWEELRLWSGYYAAHLIFHKLHDEHSAIELARKVQVAAAKAGFAVIELAALQLEGAALLNAGTLKPGSSGEKRYRKIHRILGQASALADELGLQSERGLALFNDGIAWEQQEDLTQALIQYKRALEIASVADNDELANEIRNKAAFAYEAQGSVSGAIEMLDQIGNELTDDNVALELAQNLFEKGRILMSSYRYPEAADALLEAYSLQESNGANSQLGRTGLALGHAYYGMGRMEQASNVLEKTIARIPVTGHEQDLRGAFGVLAAVYRFQGNFPAMTTARDDQAAFVNSQMLRARHTFERALDSSVSSGLSSTAALALFRQSRQLARSSGDTLLEHRALLQLCSHRAGNVSRQPECSQANVKQAFNFLLAAVIPRYALEARFAQSKILRRQGQLTQAISSISQLVDEIRYFRQILPGVLGGWYWENRDRIFSEYMSMVLRQEKVGGENPLDSRQVLLALERLRMISSADSMEAVDATVGENGPASIRSMLATRDESSYQATDVSTKVTSKEALNQSKAEFDSSQPKMTVNHLNQLIGQLPKRAGFLTFYFSASEIHAIVAGRSKVQVIKLPRAGEINSSLKALRQSLASGSSVDEHDLSTLGRLLFQPVARLLPDLIYLMPIGPLNGLPFDLLRLEDSYLVQQRQIINVLSVAALVSPSVQLESGNIDLFFLAGHPEAKREVFDYVQTMSAEIRAVTDIFVGPALHIVQGSALKRDEFQDERFERANVIHLAIPGTISLENPAQSAMMLSGSGMLTGTEFLRPADFQQRRFRASLAVLSATRVQGSSSSDINNYLGFVTDLLGSGVKSVVASLWTLEDGDRAIFMTAFYQNLANDPDVAMAIYKTRQQFWSRADSENIRLWGGFQVYLN